MTDVKQMLAVGAAVLSMLGFAASAAAEVPGTMTYTGTLNKDGKPYDGQVTAEFALYDSETGGQQVWSETIDSLPVQDGRFVAQLGSKNSLDGVFDGKELWLQVTVEGTKLKPRNHIGATPYAHRAAVADRAKEADRASNAEKLGGTKASEVTDVEASEVSYDNASSGLKATDAQAAIDEVAKLRKQVKSLKTSLEQVKQKYAKKSYVDGNFTKTSKLKSTYARKATVKKKAGQSELTFVKTQFSKLKGRVQSVESDVASNKSAISKLKADKADKTVVSKIRR
ncbi:MAG: hypothetical protein ABEL76_14730, partial [Bradymonadaceae bacterium]